MCFLICPKVSVDGCFTLLPALLRWLPSAHPHLPLIVGFWHLSSASCLGGPARTCTLGLTPAWLPDLLLSAWFLTPDWLPLTSPSSLHSEHIRLYPAPLAPTLAPLLIIMHTHPMSILALADNGPERYPCANPWTL